MNILLVYPTQITEAPMVLAMLGAVLKREGHRVYTCVNTFRKPLEVSDFVDKAKEVKADWVGISMLTFEVLKSYQIVQSLKREGFKVVLGGPHPTDCPEEGLEYGADAVVCGEGEEAILKVVRGEVSGIVPRQPRLNIHELPYPDLSVFDPKLFEEGGFIKGFHRIYTSRGCPGVCTFCDWKVFGQTMKTYDLYQVLGEIKRRRDLYGITSFSIADDCFTENPARVSVFCNHIKKLGVSWRANSRANLVNLDLLEKMKLAGCHSIAFGLESGDRETLRRIGKKITLEQNIAAPKMAHKAGLEVYGCLMTGFPWETPESVRNQIEFIRELWDDVSLFQVSGSLMPFPGAAIYKQFAKKEGFEKFWLRPEYQRFGIQVYQNSPDPYAVSTLYQRLLFDDTYIRNEYFFKYSREYKRAVRRMVWEIGRHNLRFMFRNPLKRYFWLGASGLSMFLPPALEKKAVSALFHGRSRIESLRDRRRGIAKSYTNPN